MILFDTMISSISSTEYYTSSLSLLRMDHLQEKVQLLENLGMMVGFEYNGIMALQILIEWVKRVNMT